MTCNSRDMQRTSDQWGSIFLGSHDFQAQRCSLRILGNRLVQSIGAGCNNYGNQARHCITGHVTLELIRVPSPSFACANFISTAATIGTNYKPNSHKTIGIYAAVLISQGTTQSSSIYCNPSRPRANPMQARLTPLACVSSSI